MTRQQEIERSIIKKFRKRIWNRFIGGLKDYRMISAGDRIAVCISGGKDSMLLAKCIQELERHSEIPFSAEYIVMDPGYAPENLERIKENAELMAIPVHIFEANIFDYVYKQDGSPCYLCARMRRGFLYKEARELGCNKIALGHHFDDIIETVLMSMTYGAELNAMLPRLKSTSYKGMELIRPLCLVRESDIIAWARYNSLEFLRCACRFTERNEEDEFFSARRETKELIRLMEKTNSSAGMNIYHAMHRINLSTVMGYKQGDNAPILSFLSNFEERETQTGEE